MLITKAILHILDFNSGVSVFSEKELDLEADGIYDYLEKHLEKVVEDPAQKHGVFTEESCFLPILKQYLTEETLFVDFSSKLANRLYDQILPSNTQESVDFMVLEYTADEVRHLGILLFPNKVAYTHQVVKDDVIHNEIIRHHAILPGSSQKLDCYAVVDLKNFSIGFLDKKRTIDQKNVLVLPELFLQCTSVISAKEAVKLVKTITKKVADEYGANAAVAISKAKSYMIENAESADSFCPFELGNEVFSDSEVMRSEYENQVKEANLPADIQTDKPAVLRTSRNHKIKTDTGIEITFPVDYYHNQRYIDFINNEDGTISIEIKNIGKITNRS